MARCKDWFMCRLVGYLMYPKLVLFPLDMFLMYTRWQG